MVNNNNQLSSERGAPSPNQEQTVPVSQKPQPYIQKEGSKLLKIFIYVSASVALLVLGAFGFWVYQEKVVKKPVPLPIPSVIPSPTSISKPTLTPESLIPVGWKTYSYKKSDFKTEEITELGVKFADYEYDGTFSFKYPPEYDLSLRACSSGWLKERGLFCFNIGNINFGQETSPRDGRDADLEIFDLSNKDHLNHFNTYGNVLSVEFVDGYRHNIKKIEGEIDTTPSPGYEEEVIFYKTEVGSLGFMFALRNDLPSYRLEKLEKEILRIISSIEVR